MKKLVSLIILSAVWITQTYALGELEVENTAKSDLIITRGDIKILEATENIRFLSQQIVKGYLFLFNLSQYEEEKEKLNKLLVELTNNLKIIEHTTKDSDTKDILDFLDYSKDQIAQIFAQKPTKENAALMLDYSETLLEGADSIAHTHMYDFSSEEKMLIITKKMEYQLERIMKYYIALHIGFNTPTNRTQLQKAIEKFDKNLDIVSAYPYPKHIISLKETLLKKWHIDKVFLKRSKEVFIPQLMNMSAADIEKVITKITVYHNQNQ